MDNEKGKERLENMKRKLEILGLELLEQGIDINNLPTGKPIIKLGCQDIIDAGLGNCSRDWDNLNSLYENLPEQTTGLSFHDINCNEMAMMAIEWNKPIKDCIIKANEIFVHTFLENI